LNGNGHLFNGIKNLTKLEFPLTYRELPPYGLRPKAKNGTDNFGILTHDSGN